MRFPVLRPLPGRPTACVSLVAAAVVALGGCEEFKLPPEQQPAPPPGATPSASPAPADGWQDAPPVSSSQNGTVPGTDGSQNRVAATAGVGAKGRGYGGGLISEPIRQKFLIEQRLVFDVQIPHALQLYRATHEKGPQSNEEFMQEIIRANGIQLPELPPGERFVFDPQSQQLMVERPLRPGEVPPGNPPAGTLPPSNVPGGAGSGP